MPYLLIYLIATGDILKSSIFSELIFVTKQKKGSSFFVLSMDSQILNISLKRPFFLLNFFCILFDFIVCMKMMVVCRGRWASGHAYRGQRTNDSSRFVLSFCSGIWVSKLGHQAWKTSTFSSSTIYQPECLF